MITREDLLYMIACITNKKIKYKHIRPYLDIPGVLEEDELRFTVVLTENGQKMELLFTFDENTYKYTNKIGYIMETLFRETYTEFIIYSDSVFTVEEFNFEAIKGVEDEYGMD